jgi:GNAT superfamily N-acetyltransferase
MDFKIREVTLKDIEEIQKVRNSVRENVLSNPMLVSDNDVEDYILNRGKGWVAVVNDSIIGFSIVSVVDKNVWALFLRPEFERQGIGRKLHDIMLKWYFEQTDSDIWLSTSPETRAEKFYRSANWKQIGMHGKELKLQMTKKIFDQTSR